MLPQITLDDQNFTEITEKARKQIAALCPEWTDYNYHDPGITLLELFAWFTEMQQFYLDQTGEVHEKKYLNLMGTEPKPVQPASAVIRISGVKEPFVLPEGSRFFAGDICFETVREEFISPSNIVKLKRLEIRDGEIREEDGIFLNGEKLHFPVFGKFPRAGNELLAGLSHPLDGQVRQSLYFHFFREDGKKRNPVGDDEGFIPLAQVKLFYLGETGWKPVEMIRDFTHQFLWDGFLDFRIEDGGEMAQGEDGCYWLKFVLCKSEYDMPPVLDGIGFNRVKVLQQQTIPGDPGKPNGAPPERRAECLRSLGAGGNVKAKTIIRCEGGPPGISVENERDAACGRDEETIAQSFERLKSERRDVSRAVTFSDYETLAAKTPGLMIESVRAIPVSERKRCDGTVEENVVALVVKPYSMEQRPHLTEACRKNMKRMLEAKRMIGTKVLILSPEYVGVGIYVEIAAKTSGDFVKQEAWEAVCGLFDSLSAEFGAQIRYSAVYGRLDVLESVAGIISLSMEAQGKNIRRSRNGDLFLPANGLPYLKEWNCTVSPGT